MVEGRLVQLIPAKMRSILTLLVLDARYRKLEFYGGLLLYLAVLVLGSVPGARTEIGELASGLALHVLTYSLITALLFGGAGGSARRKAYKSFLIVATMGVIDEYIQSFFSYRSANVMDWFVDINAGFFTAALLWIVWPKEVSPDHGKSPLFRTVAGNERNKKCGKGRATP